MNNKIKSIIQIFLPLLLGGIVGFALKDKFNFASLNKPPLAPPAIVFPIAWTILYLFIGIAYYLYRKQNDQKETILLYYFQLFINLTWPIIFFAFKQYFFAIIWILILIISILLLIKNFLQTSPKSAYLFIFYLLWSIFATYLNIGIYFLN